MAGLWLCRTTLAKACFFIVSIYCISTATLRRQKPGMSLRIWQSGFRLVSAPKGIGTFGAMSGKGHLPRLSRVTLWNGRSLKEVGPFSMIREGLRSIIREPFVRGKWQRDGSGQFLRLE